MAVNWNWNNKKGTLYCKNHKGQKYKLSLYHANCLGAILYEYKDSETDKSMYQFDSYWNDERHLMNCLGLTKAYKEQGDLYKDSLIKIKLDINYKDNFKIAKLFAEAGHKVELYKGKGKK